MTFKKISLEEIHKADYENLIGLLSFQTEEKEFDLKQSSRSANRNQHILSSKGKKVPIEIDTVEQFKYFHDLKLKQNTTEKWLVLKNPSETTRLWNIKLSLSETDQYQMNELSPNGEWRTELKSDFAIDDKKIEIIEKVSTHNYISDPNIPSDYLLESNQINYLYFTLNAKYRGKFALSNVKITKTLPTSILKFVEIDQNLGEIDHNRNRIVWKINSLNSQTNAILKFKIQIPSKIVQTGKISAEYRIDSGYFSEFEIKDFNASLESAQFLSINEYDEKPDVWDCALSFLNQSEFDLTIFKANLYNISENEKNSLCSIKSPLTVKPFEEKIILNTVVEQKDEPKLSKDVKFSPDYETTLHYVCFVEIDDIQLELVEIQAKKEFSVEKILSFRESSFNSTITLQNFSSIPINNLFVLDTVPQDFQIGDIKQIRLKVEDKSISLEDFNKEVASLSFNEELDLIEKQKTELSQNIQHFTHELEEKQINLDNLEKSLEKFGSNNLSTRKQALTAELELEKNRNISMNDESKKFETKISKYNAEAKKIKEEISSIEETIKCFEQESQLSAELDKKKENLTSINKKIKDLNKTIKDLQQESKQSPDEQEINKDLDRKSEKLDKDLQTLNEEVVNLKEKIKTDEKSLKDLQNKLKNNKNLDSLKKSSNSFSLKLKEIFAELESLKNQNDKIKLEIKASLSKYSSIQEDLDKISSNLDEQTNLNKNITDIKQDISTLSGELSKFAKDLEILVSKETQLTKLINPSLSSSEKIEFLLGYFNERIQQKEAYFNFYELKGEFNQTFSVLCINNLDKFFTNVESEKDIIIEYPISANSPRNNMNYEFPCRIYYDFNPPKGTQEYRLSEMNLPTLEIEHKRKKLSLGKISKPFPEPGKFAVKLLVRNNGDYQIEHLNLLDYLPKDAVLSNVFFNYTEQTDENFKIVSWEITNILPHQEISVNYILETKSFDFDINKFELNAA